MNNSKYCLTKKIKIKINDEKELLANLDDFYPIKIPIYDFIELPGKNVKFAQINDLRNPVVELFTNYYHICYYYNYFLKKNKRKRLRLYFKSKICPYIRK